MMYVERAADHTEGHGNLPSKGPLSIHQKALFVFWVSVVSLAAFRKLLVLFKVPYMYAFRPTASGKLLIITCSCSFLSNF